MIQETIDRLKQRWAALGVVPNPGVNEAAILEFEEKYQIRLPPDLRAYFMAMNGMTQMDGLTRLWPLEEVAPVSEFFFYRTSSPFIPDAHSHFIIGDYGIETSYWATRLTKQANDSPVVVIYDISSFCEQVAPNFLTFIEKYLTDEPESLI